MASKIKKNEKFDVGAAVRNQAREIVGQPKSTVAITPKNRRDPKYKEDLTNLSDEKE